MRIYNFSGTLGILISSAISGTSADIDFLMQQLNSESSLPTTRAVDYAISLVITSDGINRLAYYLYHGSQIQRNYCSLFFNRRGDWQLVKAAYEQGLIDEAQAFAR